MNTTNIKYQDIITFWFKTLTPKQWFIKDAALDQLIHKSFHAIHAAALRGELYMWRETPEGRLAEIIVLDQFSRNMFRDNPKAFASDTLALVLAQEAIRQGDDQRIVIEQRAFMYMPYMHSESALIHEQAEQLFSQPGAEYNYEFELKHQAIIKRFGRYPHRNAILGRESTPEEITFLKQPESSF
ncbi:DUF924 family protein [Ghiorsea bivora]|uniref:DUF924 family protein n=1 Tax=Ghiorsea bivora TaxID=1485545 RepID=UPI00057060CD|nr:DUF924 family protein [Ghiorsea bivora]